MKIKHIKYTIALLPLLLLFCNKNQNRPEEDKQQAIIDAKNADFSVHYQYLECYALEPEDKRACLKMLTSNIKPEFREKMHYTLNYGYEAEKLGFMHLLKTKGVECDSLQTSPRFSIETESYVAKCKNGNIYLLRFGDNKKEWQLIK